MFGQTDPDPPQNTKERIKLYLYNNPRGWHDKKTIHEEIGAELDVKPDTIQTKLRELENDGFLDGKQLKLYRWSGPGADKAPREHAVSAIKSFGCACSMKKWGAGYVPLILSILFGLIALWLSLFTIMSPFGDLEGTGFSAVALLAGSIAYWLFAMLTLLGAFAGRYIDKKIPEINNYFA